jgi:hypothetical protein
MRRGKIILCCIILGVFSLLILFHWYLGTGETPFASALRRWYFVKRFGHGYHYIPEGLSFELPAFICGAAIGYFTFESGKLEGESGKIELILRITLLLLLSIAIVVVVRISREFYPELKPMLIEVKELGSFDAYFNQLLSTMFLSCTGATAGWLVAREIDDRSRTSIS